MNNLTPYQGSSRQYGFFRCTTCNRIWESGNSWANTGQKCQKCNVMVYPYEQQSLTQSTSTDDSSAPHPQDLCGKCLKLGYPCNSRYFN